MSHQDKNRPRGRGKSQEGSGSSSRRPQESSSGQRPAWGNQGASSGRPEASAWGPPVGAPRNPRPQQQSSSAPAPQSRTDVSRPSQPSQSGRSGRPDQPRPGPSSQAGGNGGGKRTLEEGDASRVKFHADNATRGDAARGALRRTRRRDNEEIIVTRPGHIQSKKGSIGAPIKLTSNYFKLNRRPEWQLFVYHVEFKPEIELRGIKNRLIFEQKAKLGGYLFDGTKLFMTKKLDDNRIEIVTRNREGEEILIIIKFVGLLSMTDSNSLQVLNLILRRAMEGLHLQLVGRNYFDAAASIPIREYKIELWPGYTTSIRQHEQDILVNAEITHKVMRNETILDILRACHAEERDWQKAFSTLVLGSTVLTTYNNKTYRIDDIDFSRSPSDTFATKDGNTTFIEYYQRRYNKPITDKNQPLLISRAKAKDIRAGRSELIALVPELCNATGITDKMRDNFRLMAAMSEYTRVGPSGRVEKLLQFNRRLSRTPESMTIINEWNLKLDANLVDVPGRVLPKENILFFNPSAPDQPIKVPTNAKADWTREFDNKAMYASAKLTNWHIITPERLERDTQELLSNILRASRGMKFEVNSPTVIRIPDDRQHTYNKALDNSCNQNPQLIMCVVSNKQADRYSAIKKKCCVDRPVPTQVITARTMQPKGRGGLLSIATKVAIQLNCKLGGAPWMIDLPLRNLMTIGFDVCHDSRDKSKSFGALVATMDMRLSPRFFSAVSAHTNGEELSNELSLNVVKALTEYQRLHGCLPDRIMFYRDGVGEGQTQYVFEHEVQNLIANLDEVYKHRETKYRLCFVIVSKRINTRFFVQNSRNPEPGTVVDDVVTLPERYDFFLVSQAVTQGTASPTSYNVIHDNFGFAPERIQQLTYKMTHLYYNWSGTTRVPAVCQYAHKLAYLVSQYIHQSPAAALDRILYFL